MESVVSPMVSDIVSAGALLIGIAAAICVLSCVVLVFIHVRRFLDSNGYAFSDGVRELYSSYKNVRFEDRMRREYLRQRRFEKTFLGRMRRDWRGRSGYDPFTGNDASGRHGGW